MEECRGNGLGRLKKLKWLRGLRGLRGLKLTAEFLGTEPV
jgi:hypothetical protein